MLTVIIFDLQGIFVNSPFTFALNERHEYIYFISFYLHE